jgi:hypothetical protein
MQELGGSTLEHASFKNVAFDIAGMRKALPQGPASID